MTLPIPRSAAGLIGALAASAAFVLLGALPILAALGVLRTSDPIEPLGRIVAFLFGAAFVTVGTGIAAVPLLTLARTRGALTWREAVRLGRRLLLARADGRSAMAAASVAALAAIYGLAVAGVQVPVVGAPPTLIAIVAIEFLVIHGFLFFAVAAWFARATRGIARALSVTLLVGLLGLYAVLAWAFGGGLGGVGALLYLVVPNLLALTGSISGEASRLEVVARWGIKFALFAIVAGSVGDSTLSGPGNIPQGAAYFTLLAAFEMFRVAEIPGDLARAWSAGPGRPGGIAVADVPRAGDV